MTTEEYTRQYMPGDKEKQEDSARYDEIVAYVESGRPLPDGFDSTIEKATASYIKSRGRERHSGALPEAGYQKCLEDMRRSFVKEYRAHMIMRHRYKEILANGLRLSRICTDLLKNIGQMSDEEIIDKLLALFGNVFNESEEALLRKRWHEGKEQRKNPEKPKKERKAKKEKAELVIPDELNEAWNAFSEMRAKKRKPLTKSAAALIYKRLMEYAKGDILTAEKILNESTLNGWSGVFPLKEEEKKRSKASYDIDKFEGVDNLVALKFMEE